MNELVSALWLMLLIFIARMVVKSGFLRSDVRTAGSGARLLLVIGGIVLMSVVLVYGGYRMIAIAFMLRSP